jgi:hypothetical protein
MLQKTARPKSRASKTQQLPGTPSRATMRPPPPPALEMPVQPPLPAEEEARRLTLLFGDNPAQILMLLSQQLAVLKQHAQMLIGLCGLPVTGFSGAHMVRSGTLAASLMVAGIACVGVAAVLCLRALTQVRWVTKDLDADLRITATAVFLRRDRQTALLAWAALFVAVGLAAYLAAVAVAAWTGDVVAQ